MRTIYKYPLASLSDFEIVEMPDEAVILSAASQHGVVCLWALVDTERPMVRRRIRIIGTGHPAEDAEHLSYIGSVLVLDGTLVWHIFDAGKSIQ